jgi:hypothetical protein
MASTNSLYRRVERLAPRSGPEFHFVKGQGGETSGQACRRYEKESGKTIKPEDLALVILRS